MEVKELRIGNIVRLKDNFVGGNAMVTGIMKDRITAVNSVGTNIDSINIMYVEPIPITEELLEKCGFERNNDMPPYTLDIDKGCRVYMFKNTYGWILQYVRYGVRYDETVSKNIVMFVHQLQNAYYLVTGKELEIKL